MEKTNRLLAIMLAAGTLACTQQPKQVAIDLQDLNTSVSPAADFDEFANGGWKKRNPIPDEKSRYGSFDQLADMGEQQVKSIFDELASGKFEVGAVEQKIADFYFSGMDTAAIEAAGLSPLQPYLQQIDSLESIADLKQLIGNWQPSVGNPLFYVFAEADQKNSKMMVAYLYQGGLGMPDRDYYLNSDQRSKDIQEKYQQYIGTILKQTGVDNELTEKAAQSVYDLEKKLAESSMSLLDQRDPYKTYNKMNVEGLTSLAGNIEWPEFFKQIGLAEPGDFVVATPGYFTGLNQLLQTESLDTWKVYMKYHLVNGMADYLSSDFVAMKFDFYGKTLSGKAAQRPRWKRVQETTNSALSEAVGQMYVKKYFPPEAKQRMIELIENLRVSLGERIQQLSWMGDTTKLKALEKLNTINVKVGYPDKWKDYSALKIVRDSYVQNAIQSGIFEFEKMLAKVNKPVDKTEWYMPPQMVNAYYSPNANEIAFPAAILQPPFFYMNADDAVNYGAIGVVIGHEMIHGFDDQGRQFDKDGNLNEWWTPEDTKRFNDRSQLLVDQFSQFTVLDTIKADGKLTLGENIADLGGLNIAYQALGKKLKGTENPIDGYTPQQRFFLAYAHIWAQNIRDEEILRRTKEDVHSLGHYRVIGPLRNMPEFHQIFDVKEGDAMFLPENQRAVIW